MQPTLTLNGFRIMKKLFSTLFLLSLVFSISAQKMQTPKVDKLTGDTVWQTTTEKLFSKPSFSGTVGEQLYVSAAKIKSIYILSFSIQTGKTSYFSVDEGQKIYLKLKNDTTLTLVNNTNSTSAYAAISYGSNTHCNYPISTEVINKLVMSDVQFVRLEYSDGKFHYDIKDKFSSVLKRLVLLIKEK
jgi:hypothetical protein